MFAKYRVDWFLRSFFYNLPLYYDPFYYTQFIVHARYVDRNQSFTGFKKQVKLRTKTLFSQKGKKWTPSTQKPPKSLFFNSLIKINFKGC